ncbi:protein STICHEL [Carya illinoinensis]|uniref:AAA+ ATPase domain-containing protein n=1 Tax=Carya illinoinensis TaxID=32201 RepID=A0A8T1QD62_CARIL|nr:protein STICHEL [Carya illinoinensis]KAG6652329.1 hypothetical protein CIPAW_06G176900 [Carya illinoinensis]
MSETRVGDPSKLHLKKELTQIRKAARVLRDPGTSSSWKSPLNSSRSVPPAASPSTWEHLLQSDHFQNNNGKDKEKNVFLYNWKGHKSSTEKSAAMATIDDDDDGSSSSIPGGSVEDNLSDGRDGRDSKSDSFPSIFRCRNANPVSSANIKKKKKKRKKSKKTNTNLDALSKYRHKDDIVGRNLVNSKPPFQSHPSIGLSRDDSVGQSDDTEEYSNSEESRKILRASPLLLKLQHKNWSHSSKLLRKSGLREDSSFSYSTPALSTSSYNRYRNQNPSTVGSWDGTTTSINDGDDEVDDHLDLPGRQGCGIPCYWSKRTPKHRGVCGSCYSSSLSDTIRRKGSIMLCGSQVMYPRRPGSSSGSNKRSIASRSAQGVFPLLGDCRGGSSIGTGRSDDELSTNFGELDLEALSRLDGRRWSSSCRSQEGLEIVALNGEGEEEGTPDNIRSFSKKYKPMFFGELIGQNIVVQSLRNAVIRGRIAPVYLFHGPRGTGKTSTARTFASALNCLAPDETKPCGYCRECTDFISGKSRDLLEVDGTNKKGIDRVRYLLKKLSVESSSAFSEYKVFVIDECHLLPSKTWLAFLKFLEEPPERVVFILITTDLDNVPRTVQSRCQKYLFNKIKDVDVVARLRNISANESLDVESDALDLIALNADGSLRDAETMLEQLSLLGKRITTSLVNELVGVVSDEKLLELLELAMSSDTVETVKRARELMDLGADPMVLMSQLASLIMDIIAGTYNTIDAKCGDFFPGERSLTELEMERLKHALKLLSEAEKQLRVSSERSTWFTATLLQLGSIPSPDFSHSGSSRRQSCKATEDDPSSASREATAYKQKWDAHHTPRKPTSPASLQKAVSGNPNHLRELLSGVDGFSSNSNPKLSQSQSVDGGASAASCDNIMVGNMMFRCINLEKLNDVWASCIERCHSKTLRQLLAVHGKLVSISEVEGFLVAFVAFGNREIKCRVERFLSSITNAMEIVLRCNVEIRIILLPDSEASINIVKLVKLPEGLKKAETAAAVDQERKAVHPNPINGFSKRSLLLDGTYQSTSGSSDLTANGNGQTSSTRERRQEIPMQRIESIIHEQRLETAWLQTAEKGTPGSLSRLKPEKNQVLPQNGIYCQDQMDSMNSMAFSSQHWEDELNHEPKVNIGRVLRKDQNSKRIDRFPMSPSLLHDKSLAGNFSKNNLGYESGSGTGGCSGLFCWNNAKPRKRERVKVTSVRPHKGGRFSLFGDCSRPKKTECGSRR